MRLYLVRHGQTDWNAQGMIMGAKDIPLNSTGKEQIQFAADYLKGKSISKILSSPVLRCKQSADIISDKVSAPVQEEADFTETGFGEWVGSVYEDKKKDPKFKHYYALPEEGIIPGGERFADVIKRVLIGFKRISDSSENLALVTHADPVKVIVLHILKAESKGALHFRIDNGSITCVEVLKKPILMFANYHPGILKGSL